MGHDHAWRFSPRNQFPLREGHVYPVRPRGRRRPPWPYDDGGQHSDGPPDRHEADQLPGVDTEDVQQTWVRPGSGRYSKRKRPQSCDRTVAATLESPGDVSTRRQLRSVFQHAMSTLNLDSRIYVAGHSGLVGSAITRRLHAEGFRHILCATQDQVDLRDQAAVTYWFRANRPEFVFLVAGTVGGILANSTRPAEFIYDNMMIHATVVHAAHVFGVAKLLYLGSSCIYPRECPQPIREEYLLTGPLEPTNESYAIAKIAGIKLCQSYRRQYGSNFISAMPTNLYGPNDNFDLQSSHVLPALIRRFHDARKAGNAEVTIWGTGSPMREFLYVDDLADCCVFLMRHYEDATHINVGSGVDQSIRALADMVRDAVYPTARLVFDNTKPDGPPRKLLDVSRLHELGWRHTIDLKEGIERSYRWFLDNNAAATAGCV